MSKEQILVGAVLALMCAFGLWHDRWLLVHTKKGRLLVERWGEVRGLWMLRGLLTAGVVFGVLLAANVIRPLRW